MMLYRPDSSLVPEHVVFETAVKMLEPLYHTQQNMDILALSEIQIEANSNLLKKLFFIYLFSC